MKKNKLHNNAPILHEISSKDTGFEIPQNYFNEIEEHFILELNIQKTAPKASDTAFKLPNNYFDGIEDLVLAKTKFKSIKNKHTYNLPNHYFDNLEDRVLSKIKTQKTIFSIKKLATYVAPLAIAASLLFIFILNNNQKTVTFDSLATSEIEQFIDNGFVDIDSQSLAIAFSTVEISSNILNTSFTEDEVLDYLSNEDLDPIIYEY